MSDGVITVNNPAIWRPVLDIRDAVSAFTRAVQAGADLSGMFNVASGNFTVGQVADLVKDEFEERLGRRIRLDIRNVDDIRNYKVSCERARIELGYQPQCSIRISSRTCTGMPTNTVTSPRTSITTSRFSSSSHPIAADPRLHRHETDTIRHRYHLRGLRAGLGARPLGRCEIDVIVDGRCVGRATTGLSRVDVAAAPA